MDIRFYWLRDRTVQKHFHIYWEPGKHNLADLPTKHRAGSHHRRVRPIYIYNKETSPVSIQGCIKLLSPSNEVQTKTQVKRTIPNPEISYLCQLSLSQARAEHKPTHMQSTRVQPITDSIQQLIPKALKIILQKQKQLSRKDNLLSSLY